MTVVFDAGQNSTAKFTDLRAAQIGYVTSLPPSDHPDLLAVAKRSRRRVDQTRFPGLTALQRRKTIYGQDTRVILSHSPTLHAGQARGLDQTLAKTEARLTELADRLARGKTRRDKPAVTAEVRGIGKDTWIKRILAWTLTGDTPVELNLTWNIDEHARAALEDEIFGKRILVTNHDDWPITDVVAAYRSQSDAEFGFRQLKDPHAVSFSPMNHFTDQAIRVHTDTCVLALQLAHLIRRQADQAGLHLSWNGTAPLDVSSGDQNRHRLSRAGNRRINRVLHIMAVVQLRRDTEGRAYYRRKVRHEAWHDRVEVRDHHLLAVAAAR